MTPRVTKREQRRIERLERDKNVIAGLKHWLAILSTNENSIMTPNQICVTYSELTKFMHEKLGLPLYNPHFGIRYSLGRIMKACSETNLPCLPALVVRKDTRLPGTTFYSAYQELYKMSDGIDISLEDSKSVQHEKIEHLQKQCLECMDEFKWDALRQYLEDSHLY